MAKIAFVWQGINGRYGQWKDGLWAAMKIIKKTHDVSYHEPTDEIDPEAVVFYWESPCTINGKDKDNYIRIKNLPNKKALLFAGGPIRREWLDGFDHVFWESKINGDELEAIGVSNSLAFGINEEIMKPMVSQILYDGIHHGTCASWKRQWLLGEALRDRGLVVGRYQETDSKPFDECRKFGTKVMDEQTPERIAELLNQSFACVQTSDKWGGGQRCTLEAMACNLPVICMTDSPKNREYVEESGCGLVVEPNPQDIATAVLLAKSTDWDDKGRKYIMSKWTSKHYANALLEWINKQ